MSGLTANAKRAHAILETLGSWSSGWERSELCAVTGRCWYQEMVQADGTKELYLISGIQGNPHSHIWICIRTQPKGILGQEQAILGFFPESISRTEECCSPSWSASSTSWTFHETHFLSYMTCREAGSKEAEPPRRRLQEHSRSDHVCEVWSCPSRGALALSCNGTQFWGCWKRQHLGSMAEFLNWGCWDFSPEPRSQGACVHTMHAPAELQLGGTWGFGDHTAQFTGSSF